MSKRIWDEAYRDTLDTSSWVYGAVWRTTAVRALLAAAAVALLVAILIFMAAVNPRLLHSVRLGESWNTIDHVTDRRPIGDYTSSELTAVAGTKNWLALGTSNRGLVLMNKESLIPREDVTAGPVLDVTAGPEANSFLVLKGDQGVADLRGPRVSGAWLPGPENPGWAGTTAAADTGRKIIANDLDEKGWLLALKGRGVARYQFAAAPEGGAVRRRSWQTGALSDVNLDRALITRAGVWMAIEGGGVRFAEYESLNEDASRGVQTPPVVELEGDPEGRWATILDREGSLWIFESEPSQWVGPFFKITRTPDFNSASQVTMARAEGRFLWLGTTVGLYCYDTVRHIMHRVLEGEVVAIETSSGGEGVGPADAKVLVAGSKGLHRFSSPEQTEMLDARPIEWMSLSPDGKLCVFKTRKDERGDETVSAIISPFDEKRQTTLSNLKGWKPLPAPPQLAAVGLVGGQVMFTTASDGCFLYDPDRHDYADCSTSYAEGRGKFPLRQFGGQLNGAEGLVTVADGSAHLWRADERIWFDLSPKTKTEPTQVTEVGGSVFGINAGGVLYRYDPSAANPPAEAISGRAPKLDDTLRTATGDLLTEGDRWRVAFLHQGQLITYDSLASRMEASSPPVAPETIAQVRWIKDELLYRTKGGEVVSHNQGRRLFGGGSLPFPASQIKSIAPGLAPDTVMVGGPDGTVAGYSFPDGSWSSLPPVGVTGDVSHMQQTKQGLWATLSHRGIFHERDGAWSHLEDYTQWLTDDEGQEVWVAGPGGVARLTAQPNRPAPDWGVARLNEGAGMRDFVGKSVFAWQPSADQIVFVTRGEAVGLFTPSTNTWSEGSVAWKNPTQFAPADKFLLVLDGRKVLALNRDLSVVNVTEVGQGARAVCLTARGEGLRLAYVQKNKVILRIAERLSGVSREYSMTAQGVRDLGFDGAGNLWMLQPGRLIKLSVADDRRDLHQSDQALEVSAEAASINSLSGAAEGGGLGLLMPPAAGQVMANMSFGSARLEWTLQEGGGLGATWKDLPPEMTAPPPVWGTQRGRLAVQCVRGMRFGPEGELLLFTEAGLLQVYRSVVQLKGLTPMTAGANPESTEGTTEARTGPWLWRLGGGELDIFNPEDGRRRSWSDAGGSPRFNDDIVRRLMRASSDGSALLATADGFWSYDLERGRLGAQDGSAAEDEEALVENAAIRIHYRKEDEGGSVNFEALDGGTVFKDGRFFFDNTAGVGHDSQRLVTLVPGRALIQRDPSKLAQVTGMWGLPSEARDEAHRLEQSARGIRLVPAGAGTSAWDLDTAKGEWHRVATDSEEQALNTGLVTWYRSVGTGALRPSLKAVQSSQPYFPSDWWDVDRFVWDNVHSGGALDGDTAALITPLGPVAWRRSGGDLFRPALVLRADGLRSCETARQRVSPHHARAVGLLVWGEGRPEPSLLAANAEGALTIRAAGFGYRLNPFATLNRSGDLMVFEQGWEARGSEGLPQPALRSGVEEIPTERLVRDGQFVFDRARGAAPLDIADAKRARQWVTFTDCAETYGAGCLMCLYEIGQEADGPQVLFRDVWRAPVRLEALRSSEGGSLFALEGTSIWRGEWKKGWSPDASKEAAAVFRQGSRVGLDVGKMSWGSEVRYRWDEKKPAFNFQPAGYRLFASTTQGLALSFDVLTSLSFGEEDQTLAVGTLGGVFICPYKEGGECLLSVAPRESCLRPMMGEVKRVRRDARGQVWAQLAGGGFLNLTTGNAVATHGPVWPPELTRFGALQVHVGGTGFSAYGRMYLESNDAWGIGRSSLSGVVDFTFDDEGQTLWLGTRDAGVFKVLLDQLPR